MQFQVNADEWKGSEFKTELKNCLIKLELECLSFIISDGPATHVLYSMQYNAYFDYDTCNFNRNLITNIKYCYYFKYELG